MNRRKAMQHIGIFSASVAFWSSCNFSNSRDGLFSTNEQGVLENLTNAILPLDKSEIEIPDNRVEFIARILEVCYSPDDIKNYKEGLKKMGQSDIDLEGFSNSETEAVQFAFQTTRALTIEHFTSSEYFQTQQLNYEFIPGSYTGCVAIGEEM